MKWPGVLPGGKAVLFTSMAGGAKAVVFSLETGKRTDLTEGSGARYSPTGHLVFARGGSLLAAPFDAKLLQLTGPAVAILDGLMMIPPYNSPLFGLSAVGTLAYAPGSPPRHTLVWVDRQGKVEPVPSELRSYEEPRFSPDGKRLAVTVRGDNPDIWVLDVSRGASARLTFESGEDETPSWTPDGARVTYSADRAGSARAFYSKSSDGSGAEERLLEIPTHPHVSSLVSGRSDARLHRV